MKYNFLSVWGLLALSMAWSTASEDFKPGVKHVCVPNPTGGNWECDSVDDPPPQPVDLEKPSEDIGSIDEQVSVDPETTISAESGTVSPASTLIPLTEIPQAAAFAKLPPAHYTLQIAKAFSAETFPALISKLGLDWRQCYVLHMPNANNDWWLLAYGAFPNVTDAKAAAENLLRNSKKQMLWPRRIAHLQSENRSAKK